MGEPRLHAYAVPPAGQGPGPLSVAPVQPGPSPALTSSCPAAALNLYAQVLTARTLASAAHRLVAALAQEFGLDRVSLGVREHGRTRLLASSGLDLAQRRTDLAMDLVGAMDEALDQGLALAWPPCSTDGAAGADGILVEQQSLQRRVGGAVASLPFGQDGEAFGALCTERHGGAPLAAGELLALQQRLMLAAPALRWMQIGAMPWHHRIAHDLRQGWAALRQPEHRVRRRMLVGAALVLLFVALAPLEHGVGGRARVEGAEQRVLSAPTDGFVKTAHVRPGDRVKAGAALVDLLEQDLRLERERWGSQLAQHENAYAAAMARDERVAASTSMARVLEAQAQLALIDEQLLRGRITAPFDALVIQGDLSQSIGAPVRQGDALLTLATTGEYRVVVEVDESDIAAVRVGQTGRLALSSLPWERQKLVVARIAPLARAVDGRNVFEVEARLAGAQTGLRPGLLGRAEVVVGRLPPLWAWTRHALDRVRLAWWSWIG